MQEGCGYKNTLGLHRYIAPLAKYFTVCITYQPPLVFVCVCVCVCLHIYMCIYMYIYIYIYIYQIALALYCQFIFSLIPISHLQMLIFGLLRHH